MPLGGYDALRSLRLNYRVWSSVIIVILPAFRWRKVLLLHSPPLVPVDGGRCYPLSSLHTLAVTVVAGSSLNLVSRNVVMGHPWRPRSCYSGRCDIFGRKLTSRADKPLGTYSYRTSFRFKT